MTRFWHNCKSWDQLFSPEYFEHLCEAGRSCFQRRCHWLGSGQWLVMSNSRGGPTWGLSWNPSWTKWSRMNRISCPDWLGLGKISKIFVWPYTKTQCLDFNLYFQLSSFTRIEPADIICTQVFCSLTENKRQKINCPKIWVPNAKSAGPKDLGGAHSWSLTWLAWSLN